MKLANVFMALANTLPEYTWISLFKALNNLQRQQLITLTPLHWDYEITVLPHSASKTP